ncbi:MAG TPA: SCP2 sterol-binding domain-containing protein [Gemmatimonadales bacterium]|nr:SCP2 sterol-binding domain-containing protein [Gemmatimonadales bacterium]
MTSLFTPDGIAEWQRHLNDSPAFREAAGDWRGTLLLVEDDDGARRETYLEVASGRCPVARVATVDDAANAEFVLAASPTTWADLIAARSTPITAAFTGRLRLVRGDLLRLAPHAKAAAALLSAAA